MLWIVKQCPRNSSSHVLEIVITNVSQAYKNMLKWKIHKMWNNKICGGNHSQFCYKVNKICQIMLGSQQFTQIVVIHHSLSTSKFHLHWLAIQVSYFIVLPNRAYHPSGYYWDYYASTLSLCICHCSSLDLLHKSHNTPVPYPIMHNLVTEICT